jgi:predicted metalloprotease with PDZ domain
MQESSTLTSMIPSPTTSLLAYTVEMPHPESHLFVVTLQIQSWSEPTLNLRMPVWTPGSYLVREYARHVQSFSAQGNFPLEEQAVRQETHAQLAWQKVAKNHWLVQTPGQTEVTIAYTVFANELTVRTNHLDATHGYFNGAALFFYIPGRQQEAIQVKIAPPQPDWIVSTHLPSRRF